MTAMSVIDSAEVPTRTLHARYAAAVAGGTIGAAVAVAAAARRAVPFEVDTACGLCSASLSRSKPTTHG